MTAQVVDPGTRKSFYALRSRLAAQGTISLAIQPLGNGSMIELGGDPPMQGMSTTKVLILAALLRDTHGAANLTHQERKLAHAAITQSDNAAILSLFSRLEADRGGLVGANDYAQRLLRHAGDRQTQVTTAPPPPGYSTTFGQTRWSPTAEVRFFRYLALGCLLPRPSTSYILGLMRHIEPTERWGLGSGGFSSVAFKGGWGPEPDGLYGVRQTGVVGTANRSVVVGITVEPASTFDTGTRVITEVARWLNSRLILAPRPLPSCPQARRS